MAPSHAPWLDDDRPPPPSSTAVWNGEAWVEPGERVVELELVRPCPGVAPGARARRRDDRRPVPWRLLDAQLDGLELRKGRTGAAWIWAEGRAACRTMRDVMAQTARVADVNRADLREPAWLRANLWGLNPTELRIIVVLYSVYEAGWGGLSDCLSTIAVELIGRSERAVRYALHGQRWTTKDGVEHYRPGLVERNLVSERQLWKPGDREGRKHPSKHHWKLLRLGAALEPAAAWSTAAKAWTPRARRGSGRGRVASRRAVRALGRAARHARVTASGRAWAARGGDREPTRSPAGSPFGQNETGQVSPAPTADTTAGFSNGGEMDGSGSGVRMQVTPGTAPSSRSPIGTEGDTWHPTAGAPYTWHPTAGAPSVEPLRSQDGPGEGERVGERDTARLALRHENDRELAGGPEVEKYGEVGLESIDVEVVKSKRKPRQRQSKTSAVDHSLPVIGRQVLPTNSPRGALVNSGSPARRLRGSEGGSCPPAHGRPPDTKKARPSGAPFQQRIRGDCDTPAPSGPTETPCASTTVRLVASTVNVRHGSHLASSGVAGPVPEAGPLPELADLLAANAAGGGFAAGLPLAVRVELGVADPSRACSKCAGRGRVVRPRYYLDPTCTSCDGTGERRD